MLILKNKTFLSLKKPVVKTGKIKRCERNEKFVIHVVAMRNRPNVFLIDCILKHVSFDLVRDLAMPKTYKLFTSAFMTMH